MYFTPLTQNNNNNLTKNTIYMRLIKENIEILGTKRTPKKKMRTSV